MYVCMYVCNYVIPRDKFKTTVPRIIKFGTRDDLGSKHPGLGLILDSVKGQGHATRKCVSSYLCPYRQRLVIDVHQMARPYAAHCMS